MLFNLLASACVALCALIRHVVGSLWPLSRRHEQAALVDLVKLRLLETVAILPHSLLLPEMRAPILKRALQVLARAPGKRGAASTLGSELGAILEKSAVCGAIRQTDSLVAV